MEEKCRDIPDRDSVFWTRKEVGNNRMAPREMWIAGSNRKDGGFEGLDLCFDVCEFFKW